jgi:hypothetical protein
LLGLIAIPILLRCVQESGVTAFPKIRAFLHQRIVNISTIDDKAKGFLWPALCLLLLLALAGKGSVAQSFDAEKKPLAAIEFLKCNPIAGNMFNNDEFGDILIYLAHDRYKVFIDGRGDMYGAERMKEYCRVLAFEPGWENILEKYGITWIFFDTNSPLARYLNAQSGWKLIYSDKIASIFLKDIPLHQPVIEKFTDVRLADSTGKEQN